MPEKCSGDFANSLDINADCSAIDGRLTVYLADMEDADNATNSILEKIKDIMEAKMLDECHQAILRVMLITLTAPLEVINDEYYITETLTPRGSSMWMLAASGIVAVLAIGVGTRYKYVSQFKNDGSGELKDNYEYEEQINEEFVEYTHESSSASF
jgi:hypothetical protein